MGFFSVLYKATDIIGTIAFAASGAMLAIDCDLDLFGILFVGCITAVGGGVLRDMILGIVPPHAFANPLYITIALVTAATVFLAAEELKKLYWQSRPLINHYVNLLDAIGLGVFSVIGAQTCIESGFIANGFLCVCMGMTTGVGGGIMRDLLIRRVPAVLHKQVYAVASLAGAFSYWGILRLGGNGSTAMLLGMVITFLIRMLATHFKWDLPHIHKGG